MPYKVSTMPIIPTHVLKFYLKPCECKQYIRPQWKLYFELNGIGKIADEYSFDENKPHIQPLF